MEILTEARAVLYADCPENIGLNKNPNKGMDSNCKRLINKLTTALNDHFVDESHLEDLVKVVNVAIDIIPKYVNACLPK